MIRDGFKNAKKRTRGGDPFREDCSELVLQLILKCVAQGITLGHALSPGSRLLPADRHQPTWSYCAGTTHVAGGSGCPAQPRPKGSVWGCAAHPS